MTGRRLFLLFVLVCSLSVQTSQPSYPLIVQIPLTIDITNIVTALGGKVIDAIPGAGAYFPSMRLIRSADALQYSTGRAVVIAAVKPS